MSEIPIPNDPLTPEEVSALAALSEEDIQVIDSTILSCVLPRWRKVAMVVGQAESKLRSKYPQFTVSFYAERIRILVENGKLESQGDLSYMRFSEVRLPQ